MKKLPGQKTLKKLLSYSPDTGQLVWRCRPRWMCSSDGSCRRINLLYEGKPAFVHAEKNGYFVGAIFGQRYLAHRVIVAHQIGHFGGQVDHINGDRSDNRWQNLRVVSVKENCRNRAKSGTSTNAVMGVTWRRQNGMWQAKIGGTKNRQHLGWFDNHEDAVRARKSAEKRAGYHANHGRQKGFGQ